MVSSFILGRALKTFFPLVSILILEPMPSNTSNVSVLVSSHGLDLNAYGLLVKAPTGHKSITFPDNSDSIVFSKYVVISAFSPLPSNPISSTPATSVENLTHLVQCIHLVIIVLTSGPIFLF